MQTLVLFVEGEAPNFFLFGVLKGTYDSRHGTPSEIVSHPKGRVCSKVDSAQLRSVDIGARGQESLIRRTC
jgi:hypothetical protein